MIGRGEAKNRPSLGDERVLPAQVFDEHRPLPVDVAVELHDQQAIGPRQVRAAEQPPSAVVHEVLHDRSRDPGLVQEPPHQRFHRRLGSPVAEGEDRAGAGRPATGRTGSQLGLQVGEPAPVVEQLVGDGKQGAGLEDPCEVSPRPLGCGDGQRPAPGDVCFQKVAAVHPAVPPALRP
jgi:hypothetical protein